MCLSRSFAVAALAACLALPAGVRSEVLFLVNKGFIFDGIGVAIGHRTELRVKLSKEEREAGVPDPSNPGGKGKHGLRRLLFILDGVDKSLPESQQFTFLGFTQTPNGAAPGAWQTAYTDPGGTGFFDVFVDIDPLVPNLDDLLKDEDDELAFAFEWMADPASGPMGDGISAGYDFTATLVGIDEVGQPDRFLVEEEEEGFHPFFAPEPGTLALLGAGLAAAALAGTRRRRGRSDLSDRTDLPHRHAPARGHLHEAGDDRRFARDAAR